MPLRLITGPANAGKTGQVLAEALAAAQAGASPVLAVPNLADVHRLESELSGKAPLGIRVLTLPQLTRELWSLYGDGRRVTDSSTRDALLRRVLREGVEPELAQPAGTPGFSRLVGRIAQHCSVDAPPLAGLGGPSASVAPLIGRYREALADAGLVESGWLGELIARISPRISGPLGVARFDTLTSQELRLLTGLAQDNDVTVALTWEAGFAPTRVNDRAVALLSDAAAEHVELAEPPALGEIEQLGRALYGGPAEMEATGAVATGLASGGEAENALAARFVADEIAAGVPAERIVIAFRSVARRADGLEKALLARGVTADLSVMQPLRATQFGRAFYSLLALALGRGGRTEAMAYIASPYSGVAARAVHEQDRWWRTNRVSEPGALLTAIGKLGVAAARAVGLVRRVAGAPLSSASYREWQELADILLDSALGGVLEHGLGRDGARDAAAHQAVVRALAAMARGAGEPMDAAEVFAAFSAIQVRGDTEEAPGRVQVCDFDRVGARRFDVVILGGLTESEVSVASRDTLEDELQAGISGQSEGEEGDRIRLLFYSLVTRARTRLYLVRQEADSEGRERRASALWDDALDVYRPVGATADDLAVEPPPSVRIARDDIDELAPALTLSRREARSAIGNLRLRELERGVVSSSEGLAALANATVFSATEIEAYLECPYKWFYERVVRPEEIDRALDARELGTRAHGLLAAFYRRVAEQPGRQRVTREWLSEALALFDEVAAAEKSRIAAAGLSEELAAARAVAWARNVVGQDASLLPEFVPEMVEFGFGDEQAFSFAGSPFHGRIDRIDRGATSVFVTDYKSSRDVPGLAKFEGEAKVQAVVYACAAREAVGMPVSGSVYRSMRSGRLRGYWRSDLLGEMPQGMCQDDALDAEEFAALVARTEERVASAIAGIRAGRVARTPAVKDACAYCSIAAFCEGASR